MPYQAIINENYSFHCSNIRIVGLIMKIIELWQGKNKFFCNGRIITGPDWYKGVLTAGLMIILSILLYTYPLYYYIQQSVYAPVILFSLLLPLSLYYLFIVATKDPGYIPRQTSVFTTKSNDALNEYITSPKPLLIPHKGSIIKLKFCKTCMLFRPPRGSHCSICDICVEEFDHHCPWIGNCVGKRNYIQFLRFIISANLLSWVAFSTCVGHVSTYGEDSGGGVVISFVLMALIFLLIFFVSGLLAFHLYLVVTGATTNEKIKQTWPSDSLNPFMRQKCIENCIERYAASKSQPQFNPKTVVDQFVEEHNPNYILRNVKVMKMFKVAVNAEETSDKNKLNTMGNKESTSRPKSPRLSEKG